MPKIEAPFSNQLGTSGVPQNSRETLINMYVQVEVSGRRKITRRQRMAVEQVRAMTGVKRCIEKNNGTYYLVVGSIFYTFDGVNAPVARGTLGTSETRCTMVFDDNGDVLISDGTTGYHWDGATFSEPDTQGEIGPVTFVGGFALGNTPGTGQFKWSAVNDMQEWDGLDFATGESKSDNVVRVFGQQNEAWIFGEETIEIFPLTGTGDSAFTFNAAMKRGCGAALSVVSEDNSLFWLGDDWIPYRADGFRPMMISNAAVQEAILSVPEDDRALCEGFSYTDGFNKFVTLVFPGHLTLQYNIATQLWNIARTYGRDDWDILGSQYSNCDLYLTSTGIARLARGVHTDNGDIFERGGVTPPLAEGMRKVIIRQFILDCEVGRAPIGVTPQVMLRTARNSETFGNVRHRSIGTEGDYDRRVVFRGCGVGRRMAFEVMFTDEAEFVILGAEVDGDVLNG